MKKTFKTAVLSAVLAAVSGSVFADYKLHENSDDTSMDINVTVPKMVSITKPDDISLEYKGSGELEGTSSFCIASNLESDKVRLQVGNTLNSSYGMASVAVGQGYYLRKNGKIESAQSPNKTLPFTVTYKSGTDSYDMKNNDIQTISGARWLAECNAYRKEGSSITVKIKEDDAQHVFAGQYSTTLTLTVLPE